MNTILFIGPPASGKGTQAALLAQHLGFKHISTGKMLRDMKKTNTELAEIMDSGNLVPDDLVLDALYSKLESENLFEKLILDGTPRSAYQYVKMRDWFASKGFPIDKVIYITLSEEEAVRRLSARREDKVTGATYNLLTNPPGDDVNPDNLIIREDDKPETIKNRFKVYHDQTEPMIVEMEKDGILRKFDGERDINVIFEEILEEFKK